MSENIVILMIGVSTFLGALGLIALLWGVKTGQFDDQSKFIDAARFDGEEELRDAVMMEEKKKAQKIKSHRNEEKKRAEKEKKKNYMPAD
jgi:cbb3-type cytochrome oxidase maturation protein